MAKAKQGPRLTPVGAHDRSRLARMCGVSVLCRKLDQVDPELSAEFRAALLMHQDEFTSRDMARQMNEALRPYGLSTSEFILARHRRGECVTCHV